MTNELWEVRINPNTGLERDDWWYLYSKSRGWQINTNESIFLHDANYAADVGFTTKGTTYESNIAQIMKMRNSGMRTIDISRALKMPPSTIRHRILRWRNENEK